MERGDEKLTRPVLSFDEMPINQSLSPVNLSSSLFLPSFLFCPSSLSISHFLCLLTFSFFLALYPSVSHTYFIFIPLSSSPTLSVQFSIYLLVGLSCCLSLSLRLASPVSSDQGSGAATWQTALWFTYTNTQMHTQTRAYKRTRMQRLLRLKLWSNHLSLPAFIWWCTDKQTYTQ